MPLKDGMTEAECGERRLKRDRSSYLYFGWTMAIMPFLERQDVYDAADFDRWSVGDLDTNYAVMGIRIESFICPSDAQAGAYASTGVGLTALMAMTRLLLVLMNSTCPHRMIQTPGTPISSLQASLARGRDRFPWGL